MCFMKHGWWEVESEREQGSPGRSPHSSLTDEKWISFRFLAAVGTRKPTRTHADCPRAGRWKEAAQEGNLLRDWHTRTEKRDLCQVHNSTTPEEPPWHSFYVYCQLGWCPPPYLLSLIVLTMTNLPFPHDYTCSPITQTRRQSWNADHKTSSPRK